MYLLDTNTLIYFFKGQGAVAKHLLAIPPSRVGISVITLFELEVGIAKSSAPKKRQQQLDEFLEVVKVLSFGQPEACQAAELRARLERRGTPIGPFDTLIAGTAKAHNATLVTRNLSEFKRVRGLRVENWFD